MLIRNGSSSSFCAFILLFFSAAVVSVQALHMRLQVDLSNSDPAAKSEWTSMQTRMIARAAQEYATRTGLSLAEAQRTVQVEARAAEKAEDTVTSMHPAHHVHHWEGGKGMAAHHRHDYELSADLGRGGPGGRRQRAGRNFGNNNNIDDEENNVVLPGNRQSEWMKQEKEMPHYMRHEEDDTHETREWKLKHQKRHAVGGAGDESYAGADCDHMEERGDVKLAEHCRLALEFGCVQDWKEGSFIRTVHQHTADSMSKQLTRRYTVPNPPLRLWCDWARDAHTTGSKDIRVLASSVGERGFALRREVITRMFSFGIATHTVIQSMANLAPSGGIIDVGGYPGYWARMLVDNGGFGEGDPTNINLLSPQRRSRSVIVVDTVEPSPEEAMQNRQSPDIFFPSVRMSSVEFLEQNGGCKDYALLFVWPHNSKRGSVWSYDKVSHDDTESYAYQTLEVYKGNVVLFIGEVDGGVTFDMQRYMQGRTRMWKEVERRRVPNWPGFDDVYIAYRRVGKSGL